jgi:hypothetical protein
MKVEQTRKPLTIAIHPKTYQIEYVGWGPPPPGLVTRPHRLISDDLADILYVALSGHAYEVHPSLAEANDAIFARAFLASLPHPSAKLSNKVIAAQGEITPWLGNLKLDPQGHPIINDPEYSQTILPFAESLLTAAQSR